MSHDKLVRMANQIATFFESQPGEDQAARVAAHLKDYWAPTMRAELARFVRQGDPEVTPLVAEAVALLERQAA
jgi:formate dehydrogenase subunit delta